MPNVDFNSFSVLKTERLVLRHLQEKDADRVFALRSSEDVNKYLSRKPSKSIDDAYLFISTINESIRSNDAMYWAVTLIDSDELVGTLCLFNLSKEDSKAEIGYELLPNFQGKGIMHEAVSAVIDFARQHVGLKSLEAFTHSENISSTKLLEKIGFKNTNIVEGNLMKFKLLIDEYRNN